MEVTSPGGILTFIECTPLPPVASAARGAPAKRWPRGRESTWGFANPKRRPKTWANGPFHSPHESSRPSHSCPTRVWLPGAHSSGPLGAARAAGRERARAAAWREWAWVRARIETADGRPLKRSSMGPCESTYRCRPTARRILCWRLARREGQPGGKIILWRIPLTR
eukprot:scaffold306_cov525-Prasinococcus_capsulatus_cf.AAC.61